MGKGLRNDLAEEAGGPPQAFRGGAWDEKKTAGRASTSSLHIGKGGRGHVGERTGRNNNPLNKFSLRGVVEVLEEYGLDPTAEIAKALNATDTKSLPDGSVVEVPKIDAETRAKLSLSLLEYVQPKLKSVEVINKGPELTDEQIEKRIEALVARNKEK